MRCMVYDLCDLVTEDINHKFVVKLGILSAKTNISTKMICFNHAS